ncbi:nuclear transport factor 2 family protein [Nitriliruptor alkaliphilus]|uniref:nuclear transport factor 2 family protein n=1 Tax=Nitriliruptor alkaliphilus TaxID=427918 RepID=UPI0006990DAC|nr:nuclear transport factor 2 family protein [Nitriliruptor alkaliphilus]
MTDQTPVAVATRYFDALRSGDVPGAMALFSPDIVWHQPGSNRFSGVRRGPAEVGAMIGDMMGVSQGTFQLAVTGSPMPNGDQVAVPVRFTGTREGASMDMGGIDLLTVRDGSIVEVALFSEDGPTEDAFWGQG